MNRQPSPRPGHARSAAIRAAGPSKWCGLKIVASLAMLGLPGCRAPARGLAAAERDLARGDLTAALLALDSVIPADPDYPRARSLAAAVERRMRSAQRFLGQGLALRAEWRDDEAMVAFQSSLEVWPGLDGVEELMAATRIRCSALGPRDEASDVEPAQSAPGFVATTRPVDLPRRGAAPAVEIESLTAPHDGSDDLAELESASTSVHVSPQQPVDTTSSPAADPAGSDRQGAGALAGRRQSVESARLDPSALAGVRSQLRAGDVERALEGLEALRAAHPLAPEVGAMLTQVLHQKALLHYGQGDLGVAIDTWERLLVDDARHEGARAFLRAARTELGEAR